MSGGNDALAAQAMGADLAYIGTRFIATREANAPDEYKEMIVSSKADDIVYTSLFTGVHGSYLKGSIINAGLDPDKLPAGNKDKMNFGSAGKSGAKAWRDIWGAGQGVGSVDDIPSVGELVLRMEQEYRDTASRLGAAL
jgi:nitronate monooxygenase